MAEISSHTLTGVVVVVSGKGVIVVVSGKGMVVVVSVGGLVVVVIVVDEVVETENNKNNLESKNQSEEQWG